MQAVPASAEPSTAATAPDWLELHIFHDAIRRDFAFMKGAQTLDESMARALPLPRSGGSLVPLAAFHADDQGLMETLAAWRTKHARTYPSQFPVSVESTKRWLVDKVVGVPDRILFLILDRFGNRIGHIGFANCLGDDATMEVDNVLRGVDDAAPGILSEAMVELMAWARKTLWPEGFVLRVMHDNTHAIRFYERLQFEEAGRIPLRRHALENGSQLLPVDAGDDAPPDHYFVRMRHVPKAYDGDPMILTAGPSISPREVAYAQDAARSGWNRQWSKYLTAFETSFAEYVGVKYALATSSCTGALHIALAALGIGPGDEVLVPELTWVASANAVLYVGATPIFCDVHPDTWVLDVESAAARITEKTKAIIPVHLYGHPCDMDAVMALAARHNLSVLEDAAPSIGAEYKGQRTGSFGHFAAFSFQGAKLAVTGEGGMLVTNDDALYQRARAIWDQGRTPGTFWIETNGLKYKMSNVQAALGLAQLERNDAMVRAKRRIFAWYEAGLSGVPGISLCYEPAASRSIYWMTSLTVQPEAGIDRDGLIAALKARNVDSRPVFPAISQYPIWPKKQPPQPVAKHVGENGINLPSGVCLSRSEVDYVCGCIREILGA